MEKIGKIIGTHGLKGEIVFTHQLDPKTNFKAWDCLMIELNTDSYIPFFIEHIEALNNTEAICQLEEIKSKEEAKIILHKNIYSSINYKIKSDKENNWGAIIGYEIYNDQTAIGKIEDVVKIGSQDMFVIQHQNKEVLIPTPPEFIKDIDPKKKIIYMTLPEGLLDL